MFDFFITHFETFKMGVLVSLGLTFSSLFLGLILAAVSTAVLQSRFRLGGFLIRTLNQFLRGTPILVQIYLMYYGLGQFEWIQNSVLWPWLQHPSYCAVLALALNSSAYTTVLLQGAVRAIPNGEMEACKVLGFTPWQMLVRVLLKRAFINIWPAYTNEIIMVFKATSIASTITVLDLMGVTRQLMSETYQTMDCLLIAGVLYLTITYLLSAVLYWIKKRVIVLH